jgi:asparagine synthase (glutamine-hydrolysing)
MIMTALAGLWTFGLPIDAHQQCGRMLDAQAQYGPEPPISWQGKGVAVGCRLFPLLPEDQFAPGPVISSDGHLVLVADIRIDNRPELLASLSLPATAISDTGLLMKAIERWRLDAIARVVGDFALALWDKRSRRLVLARDYLGHRPLHYHRGTGFLAFSSMPQGLHALPDVPLMADPDNVLRFLALQPEPQESTFFERIEKVSPGHIVSFERGRVSSLRYWQPPEREISFPNPKDYADALREQLQRAVKDRLRRIGGSVSSQLSGGLDSSSVTATAAVLLRSTGEELHAITAVPEEDFEGPVPAGAFADEGKAAALVAAMHPNIVHHLAFGLGVSPLTTLDRNYGLYQRPLLNLENFVWVDRTRDIARAHHASVMLTGSMGNVGFSYHGLEALAELVSKGAIADMVRLSRALVKWDFPARSIAARAFGPFIPPTLWNVIRGARGQTRKVTDYAALSPASVQRLAAISDRASIGGFRPLSNGFQSRLNILGRMDPGNYVKGALSGWHLDIRDPTSDRRLMEFCLAVPSRRYLGAGVPRSLAREAMAGLLPATVLNERRKGHQASDWYRLLGQLTGELAQQVRQFRFSRSAAALLDLDRMDNAIRNWPASGWEKDAVRFEYRSALLRGISAGHFLAKLDGQNPAETNQANVTSCSSGEPSLPV